VLPGYELQGWIGLHAPAGTPKAAIDGMAALMAQAVADEGVKNALESRGMIVGGMSPDQMREFVKHDIVRWAEWIKLAGIHPL
jgi:tripartite-type tricarboxylate transporter receptor subunit TctC